MKTFGCDNSITADGILGDKRR